MADNEKQCLITPSGFIIKFLFFFGVVVACWSPPPKGKPAGVEEVAAEVDASIEIIDAGLKPVVVDSDFDIIVLDALSIKDNSKKGKTD